mmetsp:Transcript_67142/g.149808  ORF Transcript_67142/g.149808 Transcript_67142/m.149808 type:complete len:82 (+) Transcript_67142:331-576(+)
MRAKHHLAAACTAGTGIRKLTRNMDACELKEYSWAAGTPPGPDRERGAVAQRFSLKAYHALHQPHTSAHVDASPVPASAVC